MGHIVKLEGNTSCFMNPMAITEVNPLGRNGADVIGFILHPVFTHGIKEQIQNCCNKMYPHSNHDVSPYGCLAVQLGKPRH